jgi:hypothetical protein
MTPARVTSQLAQFGVAMSFVVRPRALVAQQLEVVDLVDHRGVARGRTQKL